MTFVSVLDRRCVTAPPPPCARLARIDVLQAIRRIAMNLDADATARTRFTTVLGPTRGTAVFEALHRLVLTLCSQGRRPFVVGYPYSPLPSAAERHVLALMAASQARHDEEIDIRLTTLLPLPWREAARIDLDGVAEGLARAGVPLATRLGPALPRCHDWGRERGAIQHDHHDPLNSSTRETAP